MHRAGGHVTVSVSADIVAGPMTLSPSGLSESAAAERLATEGPNELPSAKPRTLIGIGIDILREPMLLLLTATGATYLLLGNRLEAVALMGGILAVIGITLYQQQKTERTLYALRDLASPRALVIRDGISRRIAGREVVRDDLVVLVEGDRVPADGLVLSATNLRIDESLLTGESFAVRKVGRSDPAAPEHLGGEDRPFVYSGTMVVSGFGMVRVTATGARTELGRIGRSIAELEIGRTRLQAEVDRVVRLLALAGLSVCGIVAISYGTSRGGWLAGTLAGLTLAISMVPEEFPVILTVFLALGAWRISQRHVLTRRIPAIETLGAATVLCVDKTGTLTMNQMAVAAVYAEGEVREIEERTELDQQFLRVVEFALLASKDEPFDPMERALQSLSERLEPKPRSSEWALKHEFPLTDQLFVVANVRQSAGASLVALKGAPEAVIALCRLNGTQAELVLRHVKAMADNGLRVLGVARSDATSAELPPSIDAFTFEFLGLVGLTDPVRLEVPGAIRECRDAGIRVVMLTGDYPATAVHVARQIGLPAPDVYLTGTDLAQLDDVELRHRIRGVNVFARMIPEQKLRLVTALKTDRDVVAMTGDGVNDAPALKAADIGIAMGGRGTDVAREAAALVLMDDDFTSIVSAVRLGRRIHDNIRKAMAYALAIHVPIAGLSLVPALLAWPLVLMPVHVVFMEMIVDPACSVAFEMEPEEPDVMRRPPRDPRRRLFGRQLVSRSLLQGAGTLLVTLAALVIARLLGSTERDVRTLTFATLIVTNLVLISASRSRREPPVGAADTPNPAFRWLAALAVSALAVVLFVPPAREMFQLARPHANDLLACGAAGVAVVAWTKMLRVVGL